MKRLIYVVATLLSLCLSSVTARADVLTLTLTSPLQEMSPNGGILEFEATVSAPLSNLDNVYLNGDAYTLADPLTLHDSGFFSDFPLALAPGESFTGFLFKLTVPAGISNGMYASSFSILGGGLGETNTLATVGFNVNVVPEPSSMLLMSTAILAGLVRFRKKGGRLSAQATA
ncbi:PEP-CTERM sorting domain-containing protein [Roseateles cellulosilyticus]|uniref:PEP-CTERM sorting domain-containing protein n=1 Tax=Pelomonas cellulosilytica TaxID=2906762 RepID=A0ABS8XR28_9BURK|nr:PEP-CTERM sorting domain-containing protein [Pelomonas sp. P8]MCE4554288.1 PEP-CTERM sorting domain-containing protein [Pelomonas sp. P8]